MKSVKRREHEKGKFGCIWGQALIGEEEAQGRSKYPENKFSLMIRFRRRHVCFSGGPRTRSDQPCPHEYGVPGIDGNWVEAAALFHTRTLVCLPVLGNPHWPGNLPAPSNGFCVLVSWFLPGRVPEEVNICPSWVISSWSCNQSPCLDWTGSVGPSRSVSVHCSPPVYCPSGYWVVVLVFFFSFFWVNWNFTLTWQSCCQSSSGSVGPFQLSLLKNVLE